MLKLVIYAQVFKKKKKELGTRVKDNLTVGFSNAQAVKYMKTELDVVRHAPRNPLLCF